MKMKMAEQAGKDSQIYTAAFKLLAITCHEDGNSKE